MTISTVRLTRRRTLALGAGAAAAAALGRVPGAARAAGEIRVGYQKGSTLFLVLKGNGQLEAAAKQAGSTVSWVEFTSGPPLLEALNAGAIDIGTTGAPPPIFAQAAGTDLVYVLATAPSPATQAILVPKDSALKTVADLKGKKVAVTKGSSANALLVKALETAGLQWSDVEPVYLQPTDAKPAFEGGSVDAWSIWDPFYAAEVAASGARGIADAEAAGFSNRSYYLASRPFATDRQPELAVVLDALKTTDAWAKTHKDEVVKLQADVTGIDPAILATVQTRINYGLEPLSTDVVKDQQALADLFFSLTLIPTKIDVTQAILPSATT